MPRTETLPQFVGNFQDRKLYELKLLHAKCKLISEFIADDPEFRKAPKEVKQAWRGKRDMMIQTLIQLHASIYGNRKRVQVVDEIARVMDREHDG
jgi:hypothetical protein